MYTFPFVLTFLFLTGAFCQPDGEEGQKRWDALVSLIILVFVIAISIQIDNH